MRWSDRALTGRGHLHDRHLQIKEDIPKWMNLGKPGVMCIYAYLRLYDMFIYGTQELQFRFIIYCNKIQWITALFQLFISVFQ